MFSYTVDSLAVLICRVSSVLCWNSGRLHTILLSVSEKSFFFFLLFFCFTFTILWCWLSDNLSSFIGLHFVDIKREREREREREKREREGERSRRKMSKEEKYVFGASHRTFVFQVEEKPDVTYTDVGGCKEQIEKLKEVVETPLLHVSTPRWNL